MTGKVYPFSQSVAVMSEARIKAFKNKGRDLAVSIHICSSVHSVAQHVMEFVVHLQDLKQRRSDISVELRKVF